MTSDEDVLTEPAGSVLSWQQPLWSPMARALREARVAHGLLFCGANGVGKRVFAARVAAALLCRNRDDNGDACGQCAGCRQRAANTHPDISRLVPESSGAQIKVEQIRRFSHQLHLTAQYDSGRLGWIDPADALTRSAANSLLKILEEPPAGCHILLITDRLSFLLPTVRSRCQLWRIPGPSAADGRVWLERQQVPTTHLVDDQLRRPLAAHAAHQDGLGAQQADWEADLARLLSARANPVSVAERAAAADRHYWSEWLFRRSTDLLMACVASAGESQTEAQLSSAEAGAQRIGARSFSDWTRHVARVMRDERTNADWRLMLESLFIDLSDRVSRSRRT